MYCIVNLNHFPMKHFLRNTCHDGGIGVGWIVLRLDSGFRPEHESALIVPSAKQPVLTTPGESDRSGLIAAMMQQKTC